MSAKKTNEESQVTEQDEVEATSGTKVTLKGPCAVPVGDKYLTEGAVLLLSDDELKSQAWKHMILTGRAEFTDDPKATREYIDAIKVKQIKQPKEKPVE